METPAQKSDSREEDFIHLIRLSWDSCVHGASSSSPLPVGASPALEMAIVPGSPIRVRAVRGANGRGFSRREGARGPALAEGAAEAILRAVSS